MESLLLVNALLSVPATEIASSSTTSPGGNLTVAARQDQSTVPVYRHCRSQTCKNKQINNSLLKLTKLFKFYSFTSCSAGTRCFQINV